MNCAATTLSTAAMTANVSTVEEWNDRIEQAVIDELQRGGYHDASHDMGHFKRVSSLARSFAKEMGANELVCFVAGMFHDIVNYPKNDKVNRPLASLHASERAREILKELNFPAELIDNVCHCIHAHSFSAKVETKTMEAKCVQDADRMEALGAFGLMRVFEVSGQFRSHLMHETDPGCLNRTPDDSIYALDHFRVKLFTLYDDMKTEAGKKIAQSLTQILHDYYNDILKDFDNGNLQSGRFKLAEVFQEAGRNKIALFHREDPLAYHGRPLESEKYGLDALLGSQDPFLQSFFRQFQFELNGYK